MFLNCGSRIISFIQIVSSRLNFFFASTTFRGLVLKWEAEIYRCFRIVQGGGGRIFSDAECAGQTIRIEIKQIRLAGISGMGPARWSFSRRASASGNSASYLSQICSSCGINRCYRSPPEYGKSPADAQVRASENPTLHRPRSGFRIERSNEGNYAFAGLLPRSLASSRNVGRRRNERSAMTRSDCGAASGKLRSSPRVTQPRTACSTRAISRPESSACNS